MTDQIIVEPNHGKNASARAARPPKCFLALTGKTGYVSDIV